MKSQLPKSLKLISHLLEIASDKFGNHGCNDFDLKTVMPDIEERRALLKTMHEANGDPEEFNPEGKYECVMDWWLMSYFAKSLGKIVAQVQKDSLEEGFEIAEAWADIDLNCDDQSPYIIFSKSREQLKKTTR